MILQYKENELIIGNMENNYFQVIKDGEVFGVVCVAKGSDNEQAIVNYLLNH